jgi:predicted acyltransferase
LSYAPLRHADWNGWTPADLVFPTFLFCVGMAWALAFPRKEADFPRLWPKILRRTALLILIGLVLNALPYFDLAHLRIPGILQRIALCYLLIAVLTLATARRRAGVLHLKPAAIGLATAVLLVGYWGMLRFVPVPGFGAGHFDSLGSLPAWIDRNVFGADHLWKYGTTEGVGVTYDPEGILSTLGALVNCLLGILAAVAYRALPRTRSILGFAIAGAALVALAYILDPIMPINKRIWTSSFALLSSGVAAIALAAFGMTVRSATTVRLLTPLRVLGGNAILAFVIATLFGRLYGAPLLGSVDNRTSPAAWLDHAIQRFVGDPYIASLSCAIVVLTMVTLLLWPLHRRAIHFRL